MEPVEELRGVRLEKLAKIQKLKFDPPALQEPTKTKR